MRVLLSIGGGKEQADGILIAKKMGFIVITVDADPNCIGAKISDRFFNIDIKEIQKIIELASMENIVGVIPNPIGKYLTTVGAVNDALNLKGTSLFAAQIATDKQKFFEFALAKKIPVAKQIRTNDLDSIQCKVEFPVILKPQFGSGSRGVCVVNDVLELKQRIDENKIFYTDGLLIECYIEGEVYGADVLIRDGVPEVVCIRSKLLTPIPYRVEYAYFAIRDYTVEQQLRSILITVTNELSLKNSLMHVDFVKGIDGKVYIIELSPRPSGLMITTKLLPLAVNRNLIGEFIETVFDEKPVINNICFIPAALCYLGYSFALKNLQLTDSKLISNKAIVEYRLPELGYKQREVKNMSDILNSGYLLLKCDTVEECINAYENIVCK